MADQERADALKAMLYDLRRSVKNDIQETYTKGEIYDWCDKLADAIDEIYG